VTNFGDGIRDVLRRTRVKRWAADIDYVGKGLMLDGKPTIMNSGQITLGDDVFISSRPAQSHIVAVNGGRVCIGDRVHISYGAAIAALSDVVIHSNTRIGALTQILDSDFHRVGDRNAPGDTAPIHIGRGVSIGVRVVILKGAVIGDGATILSGSMVSGEIAPGAVVRGVPARSVVDGRADHNVGLLQLVCGVLGLSTQPAMTDALSEIPEWDSLGMLRLLLAIEETYGISLRENDFHAAQTVGSLSDLVEATRRRKILDAVSG